MENENIPTEKTSPMLQVMICTYGRDGLLRVAEAKHPRVEGVQYVVSIQMDPADADFYVPKALDRDDFRLFTTLTKGLSVNRNIALSQASAPILLISDDDVEYTEEGLRGMMEAFQHHPEADLITFRYESSDHSQFYPSECYDLSDRRKGHFISSIEIAFRRKAVQGLIWFNENFGIGAMFPSGEEDIFLQDCIDSGLKCIYVPFTIARHEGTTTSERNLRLPSRPMTKGAVLLRLHPNDWPLRMLTHAMREVHPWKQGAVPSPLSFCRDWLKGVRTARRMKVFPTPDYSLYYPCHD